jgi:hypothetical protein
VHPYFDRCPLRLPLPSCVFVARVLTNQFLLLGLHGQHRQADGQAGLHLEVDVAELGVPVRVLVALPGLGVGLQAVLQRVQDLGDPHMTDRVPGLGEGASQVAHGLGGPQQRGLGVATRDGIDEGLEGIHQSGVKRTAFLRPPPGRRERWGAIRVRGFGKLGNRLQHGWGGQPCRTGRCAYPSPPERFGLSTHYQAALPLIEVGPKIGELLSQHCLVDGHFRSLRHDTLTLTVNLILKRALSRTSSAVGFGRDRRCSGRA